MLLPRLTVTVLLYLGVRMYRSHRLNCVVSTMLKRRMNIPLMLLISYLLKTVDRKLFYVCVGIACEAMRAFLRWHVMNPFRVLC